MKTLSTSLVALLSAALLLIGITGCSAKNRHQHVVVQHVVVHHVYTTAPANTVIVHHVYTTTSPVHTNRTTHISRKGNVVTTVHHADGSVTRHTTLKNGTVLHQHIKAKH